jgi:hypothetical protein
MMSLNTRRLHDLGQSLWLDNISREILRNGTMARYIAELSLTGLTSNPTIFEHAIGTGNLYDESIADLARQGLAGEDRQHAPDRPGDRLATGRSRTVFHPAVRARTRLRHAAQVVRDQHQCEGRHLNRGEGQP